MSGSMADRPERRPKINGWRRIMIRVNHAGAYPRALPIDRRKPHCYRPMYQLMQVINPAASHPTNQHGGMMITGNRGNISGDVSKISGDVSWIRGKIYSIGNPGGYGGLIGLVNGVPHIRIGCRDFTFAQAHEHWDNMPDREEQKLVLQYAERLATIVKFE